MESTDLGRSTATRHLDGARAALRALDSLSIPDGGVISCGVVRGAVRSAMNELDRLDQALAPDVASSPRVACPFCARPVMAAATLCGFCWRALVPQKQG